MYIVNYVDNGTKRKVELFWNYNLMDSLTSTG